MLEKKKGEDHFAVRQYKKYKLAAGKTAKSILISCGARLATFDIDKVRKMMAYAPLCAAKVTLYHQAQNLKYRFLH